MEKKHKVIIGIIGALLTATLYVNLFTPSATLSSFPEAQNIDKEPLSEEEINDAIDANITWLQNAQEDNGHFTYEYLPYQDKYTDTDNIDHQALAAYTLSTGLNQKSAIDQTLRSSLEYLEKNSVNGRYDRYEFRCIKTQRGHCSTSATSLALIATINLVQAIPENQGAFSAIIEDYKNFLLAMKNENKGFRSNFQTNSLGDAFQIDNENPTTNGQAWLALIKHHQYQPNEKTSQLLGEVYTYFENTYNGDNFNSNFYLWAMSALQELYQENPRPRYVDYAKSYSDWRLEMYEDERYISENRCQYLAGVSNAYEVLKENISRPERARYEEEIEFWITHSSDFQVKADDMLRLSYSNGPEQVLGISNPDQALGGFLADFSDPSQSLDFNAHCLNALFQNS